MNEQPQKRPTLTLGGEKKTQAQNPTPVPASVPVQDIPQPTVTSVEPAPPVYHPMADAPKDGTYIFLDGDPNPGNEWFFYKTRHMNGGHWEPTGWWRQRFGINEKPQFEPKGWRLVRDGLPPR